MPRVKERRGGARVRSQLWVAVKGIDKEPCIRAGNVSVTGIFFAHDEGVGEVGSVQWLWLDDHERAGPVQVMARVVRSVTVADLERDRPVVGVALEFMPDSEQKVEALGALVRRVVEYQIEQELIVDVEVVDDELVPIDASPAFTVHSLLLEVDRNFEIGECFTLELTAAGGGVPLVFRGEVSRVRSRPQPDGSERFRVEVSVGGAERPSVPSGSLSSPPRAAGSFLDTIDMAFSDLIAAPVRRKRTFTTRKEHLVGKLARIGLPTLLGMFEMERMSGRLQIDGPRWAKLYLRDGRVVDVELDPPGDDEAPRAMLADVFGWSDGTFEFRMGDVEREDRLKSSTTALLLDLAREQDEAERDGP